MHPQPRPLAPLLLACAVLPVLASTAPAGAVEVPAFDRARRLDLVPPDLEFRTTAVRKALSEAKRPVFVVVFEKVKDGRIGRGRSSETEDAIEDVWDRWTLDPAFNAAEDIVIVLALDDREVRVRMGSRWDSELGLHGEALGRLIDEHFLPVAQTGNLDEALARLVRGASEAPETVRRQREEHAASAAHDRAVRTWLLVLVPTAIVLLIVALVLRARRRKVRLALDVFEAARAERAAKLENAEREWAEFRIDQEIRDSIVQLRVKGPRTLELYDEVTRLLDSIALGLEGLERHLQSCVAKVRAAGWLDARAPESATEALDEPFELRTGETQHKLFEPAERTVRIEPAAFMSELETKYSLARDGWQRLRNAVESSFRTARQDFPADDLETMRRTLDGAGLSRSWLDGHPLATAPEAEWSRLDALRTADPVAYLQDLHRLLSAEAELEADVQSLVDTSSPLAQAREEALALAVDDLDTVISDPERDPAVAVAAAERATGELSQVLQEADDLDAAVAAAAKAVAAWRDVAARKQALRRSVERAADAVREAEPKVGGLRRQLQEAQSAIAKLAAEHDALSLAPAWREVGEATLDVEQAEAALADARKRLAAKDHVGAEAQAGAAVREHGEALGNLDDLVRVLGSLVAAKDDATRLLETMAARRAACEQQLVGTGYAAVHPLQRGDALFEALRQEATLAQGRPVGWLERLERLREVLGSWNTGVAERRRAWDAEQERIRAAAEAAAQEQRLRYGGWSTHVESSWGRRAGRIGYSSHRGGGFFGGSHRSGGGSFGGGGRSGGRSFGGGGRSGGRKF
ncbi:MAG: hypothetical protein HY907_02900 [Deltaproteobacteria bacterium]|nr:hypothetical protein [Deltaproteobacteria bacterium]